MSRAQVQRLLLEIELRNSARIELKYIYIYID